MISCFSPMVLTVEYIYYSFWRSKLSLPHSSDTILLLSHFTAGCTDGALDYVDQLLDWARSYGLSVLFDIHTQVKNYYFSLMTHLLVYLHALISLNWPKRPTD